MTKVTKKDNFNAIIEVLKNAGEDALVEVMEHELELLARKSGTKKVTAAQKVNAVLDERIMAYVESVGTPVSASEVMDGVDYSDIDGLEGKPSLPKITNRLTALGKEAKKLDRVSDKKGVKFIVGTGVGFNTTKSE